MYMVKQEIDKPVENMSHSPRAALSPEGCDLLFREARTHSHWLDRPVTNESLRGLYDLLKWGPTSANTSPMRVLFLKTKAGKQRLLPALAPGNVDKTLAAPVTAILAYDLKFYERLGELFPSNPAYRDHFAANAEVSETTARRNGTLQGAYFMIAARALGMDCGPMSGFDSEKVDVEFFGGGSGNIKSNFLCNLGYGDDSHLFPRLPRLKFEDACWII